MTGAPLQSVTQLEEIVSRNPQTLAFGRLADAYRKRGDISQAVEVCLSGLATHPSSISGRIILGRCYLEQERSAEAITEFIEICRRDRRNLIAVKMLADIFAKQGLTEKAGDLYAYGLDLDLENPMLKQSVKETPGTPGRDLLDILEIQNSAVAPDQVPYQQPNLDNTFAEAYTPASSDIFASDNTSLDGTAAFASDDFEVTAPFAPQETVHHEELFAVTQDAAQVPEPSTAVDTPTSGISGDDISARVSMIFDDADEAIVTTNKNSLPMAAPEDLFSEEPTMAFNVGTTTPLASSDLVSRTADLFADDTGSLEPGQPLPSALFEDVEPETFVLDNVIAEFSPDVDVTQSFTVKNPATSVFLGDDGALQDAQTADFHAEALEPGHLSGDDVTRRIQEIFAPADAKAPPPSPVFETSTPTFDTSAPTMELDRAELLGTLDTSDLSIDTVIADESDGDMPSGEDIAAKISFVLDGKDAPGTTPTFDINAPTMEMDRASILADAPTMQLDRASLFAEAPTIALDRSQLPMDAASPFSDDLEVTSAFGATHDDILNDTRSIPVKPITYSDLPADDVTSNTVAMQLDDMASPGLDSHDVTARLDAMFSLSEDLALPTDAEDAPVETATAGFYTVTGEDITAPQSISNTEEISDTIASPSLDAIDTLENTDTLSFDITDSHVLSPAQDAMFDLTEEHTGLYNVISGDTRAFSANTLAPLEDELDVTGDTGAFPTQDLTIGAFPTQNETSSFGLSDTVETSVHTPPTNLDVQNSKTIAYSARDLNDIQIDEEVIDNSEVVVEGTDIENRLDAIFPGDPFIEGQPIDDLPDDTNDTSSQTAPAGFYTVTGDSAESPETASFSFDENDAEGGATITFIGEGDMLPPAPEPSAGLKVTIENPFTDSASFSEEGFESEPLEIVEEEPLEVIFETTEKNPTPAPINADIEQILSIPDHVLTPTLADIYFQQGQASLALAIYKRIYERDSDNSRIAVRILEIEGYLSAVSSGLLPEIKPLEPITKPEPTIRPTRTSMQKTTRTTKAVAAEKAAKPLKGIKIARNQREKLKKKKAS